MKGGRSFSLDTLKLQSIQAQQQLKYQNSKSQLQFQESIQQKLHRIGALQNTNYANSGNANNNLSVSSSKRDMNVDPQEIKVFVQQHNQNFNKLMSEKLDLEEEVKFLRVQNEQLIQTQQSLSVTKSKQNMDTTLQEQSNYKEYSSIKVDVMNYSIRNKELENELFQLQQQMRLYKMQLTNDSPKKFLSNTDYDPHQFSHKISDLGKIIADQKTDIQSLQIKMKDKERQIENLKDSMKELQTKINIMEQERQVLEKGYQNEVQRVKDSQAMELDSLRKLNKQLDESIVKAQNALSQSEQSKHELLISNNRQIIELQEELKKLNRSKTLIEQDLQSNLMDLKGEKDTQLLFFTNKTKELENTIQQWETKFYKQKMAHEQEIEQLKELQEQRIDLMKQEMESKEQQQQKKYDNFQQTLREAEKDKNNKIEQIKLLKVELEDIKAQLKMNKNTYEVQIEDLRQEIKRFGQSKNELMGKIEEKEKQNKKLLAEIEGYKAEIKSLEQSVETIQNQVVEIQKQQTEESTEIIEEKIAELEKEFQRRTKQYDDERILELKAQRDKYIGEIIQLEIKHKQEIERLKDRIDGYQMKDAQSQKSIDQRIQDVKDNYEGQIKHMIQQQESEFNKTKEEYDKQIQALQKDTFQREEKIKQDYESALQTQKIDFELNVIKPLRKEYNDFQKNSKEKSQSLESQLQMIKQEMEGQVTYQKAMLETNKKNFEAKLAQEKKLISQLESKIEQQIQEIKEFQDSVQQQSDQIKQLNTLINIIKCEKAEQCNFLEEEISKIHDSYTSKEVNFQLFEFFYCFFQYQFQPTLTIFLNIINKLSKNRMNKREQYLNVLKNNQQNEAIRKYEQEIQKINIDNMKFILKIKSEFDELLLIEHQKYEKVLMEYEELLRLYDAKGCREIDAILIQNLKDECLKTQEELKYLILEVVNREKMYNKIFTNYQETEFMQMLLKKAERMEQVKQMISNNEFIQKENDQSQFDLPINNSDMYLPNLNMSTRNNNEFLPQVNTTKSFKGFKTEDTASTSNNSGPLKFTQKIVSRGFDLNTSQSKNKTPLSENTSAIQRGLESKRPNTTTNIPPANQIINQNQTKQIQPHYIITQLNQTNSVFKGDLQQSHLNRSNYNSNNMSSINQQQISGQEQFNSLDIPIKQSFKYKVSSTKNQYHKSNSNILNDNSFTEVSNPKRKYNNRDRRCLSQMSDYQEDNQLKQGEYLHTYSNTPIEEPLLVLNAQSVNIQKQPQTPSLTQGNQRRKYSQNKEIIKNKAGMYRGAPNFSQINQQQRFSAGNISISSQINLQQELLPALQSNKEDYLEMHENMQLRMMNEKSDELQNHHNDSQMNINLNQSMQSQPNSSSLPPESRKPSYAQIYAQIFMNKVSRVVKTQEGNANHRKKFV